MPEFLLEIGCEEIPAPWLGGLCEQLARRFEEAAAREHLVPAAVAAFATPRRLVLRADVAARQADREEKVFGPSLKVAKDASGGWTGAAQGFARKSGARVEDLAAGPKDPAAPEDLYLYFVKKTPGRQAVEVLPGVIAALLRGLAFPKRMSWDAWLPDGKGALPFGRPIRWMVALLAGEVVPFAIHELVAGAKGAVVLEAGYVTRGHRFLPAGKGGESVRVTSFEDLRAKLEARFVLLDPAARAARITAQVPEGAAHAELLEEWRDLVEYPTVVSGRIPSEFHTLPEDVLQTVLVHHQKYVPLRVEGAITRFAAVTNTDGTAAAAIVRGMERVVVARLRDAAFFFAEDRKRPLEDRVADLAGVVFHQGLGSYKDKTDRMVRLVDAMGAEMGLLTKPEHEAASKAARLAKADLTTLMVREFPELQGRMGAIYLEAEGQPWANVISAVRWHYHPTSVEEEGVPAKVLSGSDATVFGAVSIADKLDTLAGYFALGLAPSGSSDPFALRRAAQGVVRVLLDFWTADTSERRPSLARLVAAAVAGFPALKLPPERTVEELQAFLLDRLRYVLVARGFPADEVEAVLGAQAPGALEDPHECLVRLRALHHVRKEAHEDFEHLAVAFKRAKNILVGVATTDVEGSLFQDPAERELHAAVVRLQTADGGYDARLRSLAELRAPVDRFFDDVLVMAEDPKVRANRLGLLSQALSLFYRIADISKLGG